MNCGVVVFRSPAHMPLEENCKYIYHRNTAVDPLNLWTSTVALPVKARSNNVLLHVKRQTNYCTSQNEHCYIYYTFFFSDDLVISENRLHKTLTEELQSIHAHHVQNFTCYDTNITHMTRLILLALQFQAQKERKKLMTYA